MSVAWIISWIWNAQRFTINGSLLTLPSSIYYRSITMDLHFSVQKTALEFYFFIIRCLILYFDLTFPWRMGRDRSRSRSPKRRRSRDRDRKRSRSRDRSRRENPFRKTEPEVKKEIKTEDDFDRRQDQARRRRNEQNYRGSHSNRVRFFRVV